MVCLLTCKILRRSSRERCHGRWHQLGLQNSRPTDSSVSVHSSASHGARG